MNTPVLKLDPEDVVMAMSDQMTQWLIDPITGKLCLDREEADIAFGGDEADLWAPTDPNGCWRSPISAARTGIDSWRRLP